MCHHSAMPKWPDAQPLVDVGLGCLEPTSWDLQAAHSRRGPPSTALQPCHERAGTHLLIYVTDVHSAPHVFLQAALCSCIFAAAWVVAAPSPLARRTPGASALAPTPPPIAVLVHGLQQK